MILKDKVTNKHNNLDNWLIKDSVQIKINPYN